MLRFDICNGDTTTAGGTVIAVSHADFIDGRCVAYEQDSVWCPKCRTEGRIVCVGKRVPTTGPDRREAALSGDWCVCKCDPPPTLIARQERSGSDASGL